MEEIQKTNNRVTRPVIITPLYLLVLLPLIFIQCNNPSSSTFADDLDLSPRRVLISPEWLKNEMIANPDLVVAKVMWGGPSGGYIPGSIHINTDEIEYDEFRPRSGTPLSKLGRTTTVEQDAAKGLSASDSLSKNWWNLFPDNYLLKAIAHMGITLSSEIVVYGEYPDPAARLAWCLKYAGVKNVYFLNGGLKAWINSGNDTIAIPANRIPKHYFGASKPQNIDYKSTTAFVRSAVANGNPNNLVVDVRTYGEYTGEYHHYHYINTKGRIHNAVFGKNAGNANSPMKGYYGENHEICLKDIHKLWQEAGITPDKQVTFYCGTGWRSSLAWLVAHSMGYDNIKNYDGGWYEWSMGPEKNLNPSETGGPAITGCL